MTVCAVIPVYNHGAAIGAVVRSVLGHGLKCVLVDDGSVLNVRRCLHDLAFGTFERVIFIRWLRESG